MPNKKVTTSQIIFYDETFATQVKSKANQEKITVGVLAKRCMASVLHLELPQSEQTSTYGTAGKYAHIIGKNKIREQNLKNLTQYILDNWSSMPDDIKAQVIQNQDDR